MSRPIKPPEDPAHDVLAAEAFAMPSADPSLRHQPIMLPDDPSGIAEPHDVLAAEEFPMPAPRGAPESGSGPLARAGEAATPRRIGLAAAVALLALVLLRRRRRV
jgi:MYXO-CTERM domain-containing protein